MDVEVKNRLAGSRADIGPDVVTVRFIFCLQVIFNLVSQFGYGCLLFKAGLKIGFYMTPGYNQGMAFAGRAAVIKSEGQIVFSDY